MALKSAEIGANTYSEVILGLPGDTKEKHFSTLKTLVESSFYNFINVSTHDPSRHRAWFSGNKRKI